MIIPILLLIAAIISFISFIPKGKGFERNHYSKSLQDIKDIRTKR